MPCVSVWCAGKPLWHKLRHVESLCRRLGSVFIEQNEEHGERENRQLHVAYASTSKHTGGILIDQMATKIEHVLALRLLLRAKALSDRVLCAMVMDQRPTDVGRLLSDGRADPDARDAEGDPVLNLAAAHGQLDSLQLLIGARADLEARSHQQVCRPRATVQPALFCVCFLLSTSTLSLWVPLLTYTLAPCRAHTRCGCLS